MFENSNRRNLFSLKQTNFSIVFVNVNSLMNKMDSLQTFVEDYNPDIIGIGETWLLPTDSSSFVALPEFSFVRADTAGTSRKHGVGLYVRNSLKYVETELSIQNVVGIHLTDLDVWLLCVYRPPSYNDAWNQTVVDIISNFCIEREVVVIGDFNLPSLNWRNDNILDNYVPPLERDFFDCFTALGLSQWVREATFKGSNNILDLILTTETDRVGDVQVHPPWPHCHHNPVLFEYVFQYGVQQDEANQSKHSWHRANFTAMRERLSRADWDFEFEALDVNECFNTFQACLLAVVDKFVPVRRDGPSRPWKVHPPRELKDRRSTAWQNYKTTRDTLGRHHDLSVHALMQFNTVNREYRNFEKNNRRDYERHLINELSDKPKLFHSYIRYKKKGCPTVGPLRAANGDVVDEPAAMSELFATAFSSVFDARVPQRPVLSPPLEVSMSDVFISVTEVCGALESLDENSAMGPDSLHPIILKRCADYLAYPLAVIYNKSLNEGVLPDTFKSSRVVPIFKNGSRYDPLNYRPVSLTSVCCKTMERLVVNHLVNYLES